MLRGKRRDFGNLAGWVPAGKNMNAMAQWIAQQFDPALGWKDVAWIRSLWPGKLVLKGILDAEDARIAADHGADAIVVSNHGGRQLDSAPATITVLPDIAAAVGHRTEILFDGGIRSGQDVLKAVALGAKGTLIGRSWLYGLAAGGEAGVRQTLEILRKELDVSMALAGLSDIRSVDRSALYGRHTAG